MTATKCATPEYVILVDDTDCQIGLMEKLEAHAKNRLHRAFSVFIFRQTSELELLLQQRALHKYHSPGLWTNTCCSHPRAGEDVVLAGQRRLHEELGISAALEDLGWFKYNAHFPNGLSEHEIDHVLVGMVPPDVGIVLNKNEVNTYRWIFLKDLAHEMAAQPDQFTPWFMQALEIAVKKVAPTAK